MATVLSLEPESTTTISSAQATLSRQARRRSSSLSAMIATESSGIEEPAGRLGALDPGDLLAEPVRQRRLGGPAEEIGRSPDVGVGVGHLAGRSGGRLEDRRPPGQAFQLADRLPQLDAAPPPHGHHPPPGATGAAAARHVASTMSPTKVKSRVCRPSPKTGMGRPAMIARMKRSKAMS